MHFILCSMHGTNVVSFHVLLTFVVLQVAKHLTKLFDSMAKLRFRQENEEDTKIALYMSSKDGEEVKLSSPCNCDGQVCITVSLLYSVWCNG